MTEDRPQVHPSPSPQDDAWASRITRCGRSPTLAEAVGAYFEASVLRRCAHNLSIAFRTRSVE